MRRFLCPQCGSQVHFNNSQCMTCSSLLGYEPLTDQMLVLRPDADGTMQPAPCANRNVIGCNWLAHPEDPDGYCLSCLHTTVIPDNSDAIKLRNWSRLERAKRRLFYGLVKFGLPQAGAIEDDDGFLRFQFMSDELGPDGKIMRVMTGHHKGRITINIAEADSTVRETNRSAMGESYRSLIGHFRHEIGHYYWDKLVDGHPAIDEFRACFGDERHDYKETLAAYYENGPAETWRQSFVSAYASAHPWEDFAETWAHYMHLVSGLETAYAYGINPQPMQVGAPVLQQLIDPYHVSDFDELMSHWVPLTVAMNAMNRSMGNRDYYPFALTAAISKKLKFMHDLIEAQ